MPVTIVTGAAGTATQLETQRAIWQNPRGQKTFYAIVQEGGTNGLRLYKSTDGTSWSLVQQLCGTGSGYSATYSASAWLYEDAANSQLIVYVCYSEGGSWNSGRKVYYRRLLIPDNTSTPTVGAEQDTGKTGGVHAEIIRDRNGYVHVVTWGNSSNRDQVVVFGTTTSDPGDAPSWSAVTAVWSHGGSTSYDDTSTLVSFGGSSNILGAIGFGRSGSNNRLHGRNIVSFDGSSYSLGTDTTIEDCNGVFHPLSAVVDSDNTAHVVFHDAASGKTGLRYAKASAASSVEAWNAIANADDNAPDTCALTLDLTPSPSILYVFYQYGATDNFYWRSRAVNASSWSGATTVNDGGGHDLDWIQCGPKLVDSSASVIYTDQTSYAARYYKLTTVTVYYQAMSVTEAASPGVQRKTGKTFTVTEVASTAVAGQSKRYRTLAITEASAAALKRRIFSILNVLESSIIGLQKKTSLSLIITEVAALTLAGKGLFKRTLSAIELTGATLARSLTLSRALSVVEAATASLTHKATMFRTLITSTAVSASLAYARWQQVLMAAAATVAASLTRQAVRFRTLIVTELAIPGIKRKTSQLLAVAASSVASISRGALRYRSLIVTEISLLTLASKSLFKRTLAVIESASTSLSRKAAMYHALMVTEITVVSLGQIKSLLRTLDVTAVTITALTWSLIGALQILMSVSAIAVTSVTRKITKPLSVAASSLNMISRSLSLKRTLTVLELSVASLTRKAMRYRALIATEIAAVSLGHVKRLLRTLTLTAATIASITRRLTALRTLTVTMTAAASVTCRKFLQRALTVTVMAAVTLGRSLIEVLQAIIRLLAQRMGLELSGDEMGLSLTGSEYGLTLTLEKE